MYISRLGNKLEARRPRKNTRSRPALRGIVKPLTDEVSVDWLSRELSLLTPFGSVSTAEAFRWSYLHANLLSKLPIDSVSPDTRRKAAIDEMLESEARCKHFNKMEYRSGFHYSAERLNTILFTAQQIIAELLGDLDYSIFEKARFSGGASTSRTRRHGDAYFKYNSNVSKPVHVTERALKYACALVKCTPLWNELGCNLVVVPGNRVTTVPKKTEIDRAIAMEPDMNMSLQLAVGGHFRSKLRKRGINLNDQSHNQRLAKEGSVNDTLSTIDLSSASDSISYCLVKELFPVDWYTLLDDLRSPDGELPDGSNIVWEKFSSMGNGYTFELETIIFWAITKSTIAYECKLSSNPEANLRKYTSSQYLSVYGDDIICPSKFATSVINVLAQIGFKTNLEKTFIAGPFRESCGKHYYEGLDVTPFYVRSPIDTPHRCVWLLNKLRSWAYDAHIEICDDTLYGLWRYILRNHCPNRLRGGKDINSSSSVCMPGRQRDKLVPVNTVKSVSGPASVLRWFQGGSYLRRPDSYVLRYSSFAESYIVSESIDRTVITVPSPSLYRFKRNRELWRFLPYFSKEL